METSSQGTSLATASPNGPDRRMALIAILASAVCFLGIAPFAAIPLPKIPAFIPAYESGLAIYDLTTAILLFAQFMQVRRLSVLAIALGYLFSSILVVMHALTFPGVFSPTGLLNSGPQTTAWLYVFWHAGFPLFILLYALLSRAQFDLLSASSSLSEFAWGGVAIAVALALGCTLASTVFETYLPVIIVKGNFELMVSKGISPTILVLTLVAIVAMWPRRNATILDIWLFAVLFVWLCDISLSAVIGSARYDAGWYGGRLFGLCAASFVGGSLLIEANRLQSKLANALIASERQNIELQRSRNELSRAQKMEAIGRLTGGIAHDFNNVLTAITSAMALITQKPTDVDRVVMLADNAANAAFRGASLVRQLLTFSRQKDLKPEVLNPNQILDELKSLTLNSTGDAIIVKFDLDPTITFVTIDPAEFQAAILNLLSNARDAMHNGGTLTIETRSIEINTSNVENFGDISFGKYVLVSVSDTGIGMPQDVQDKAFEPFFTTKPVGLGTGLGLSQVYGFARSIGGSVTIQSEMGIGTVINIVIPISTINYGPKKLIL